MTSSSDKLVLLDAIPGEMTAHAWQNVLIACWPKLSNVRTVQALAAVRSGYLAEHPEGASLIHIAADASVPDAATSAAWVEMMKLHSDRIVCIGIVIAEHGFRASAVRSWVTDKRMVRAPGNFKMRFHANVDEILEWLPEEHARRTGVTLHRATLQRHLRDLRDATVAPKAD